MMSATFALTCDACEAVIAMKSQPDIKDVMNVPDRITVAGMDLCEVCRVKAITAMRSALGLHEMSGKRVLN